jgi:putative endonuclease
MTAPKTSSSLSRGHSAEHRACRYLEDRGLALLERNYRTPFGEIDLVMEQDGTLVFVEVRLRRSNDFGGAAASVGAHKRRRLRASAQYYLQRHHAAAAHPCRFDVVALTGEPADARLEWLPNAFED